MFPWSTTASPAASSSMFAVSKCNSRRTTPAPLFLTAAKIETDHEVGPGNLSVTGKYDSKKDAFGVDFSYAPDDNNTLYAAYAVTDEKITCVGIESGLSLSDKHRGIIDATYIPPADSARVKLGMRQGKTKLNGYFSFATVSSNISSPNVKLEFDSKLSANDGIRLGYDISSKSGKLKYGKKLDSKNKLDAEYIHTHDVGKSFVVKLSHTKNKNHAFSAAFNYGAKRIAAEWNWNTDSGPWTVNANVPFNASPMTGDWSVKRRFEL